MPEHVAWRRPAQSQARRRRGAVANDVPNATSAARADWQQLVETGAGDEIREAPCVVRLDEREVTPVAWRQAQRGCSTRTPRPPATAATATTR